MVAVGSHVTRIDAPWGARTAYAGGEEWPARVDLELGEGIDEAEVDRWAQSACVLCSNGCGLDIAVKHDRIVGVRGRGSDRVNRGRLGPKGLFGWQANNAEDRLTSPLVRRRGELVEASWDEAMNLVASRSRELIGERTAGSIGFYTSGQLFL